MADGNLPVDIYDPIIEEAGKTHNVDPHLIRAVIKNESAGRPRVLGPRRRGRRAMGLMQLQSRTAKSVGVTDPMDPKQNIMGGTKYIRQMLDRYDNNIPKALAAYNAGPGRVPKEAMGLPKLPKETERYVSNVIMDYDTRRGAGKNVTTEP